MKRLCLAAAAVLLIAGSAAAYNPYAPNPFDTMEKNSWEYQYLYELSEAGLTQTDMHVFSPSYTLTRFEMAQMVAAAMRNRSHATAQEQEKIDKLAQAFASDLQYEEVPAQETTAGAQEFQWK